MSFKFFELRVRWCQDKPWLGGMIDRWGNPMEKLNFPFLSRAPASNPVRFSDGLDEEAQNACTCLFCNSFNGWHRRSSGRAAHEAGSGTFEPIPLKPPANKDVLQHRQWSIKGRRLFEPRLSQSHNIGCNACHQIGLGGVKCSQPPLAISGEGEPKRANSTRR